VVAVKLGFGGGWGWSTNRRSGKVEEMGVLGMGVWLVLGNFYPLLRG